MGIPTQWHTMGLGWSFHGYKNISRRYYQCKMEENKKELLGMDKNRDRIRLFYVFLCLLFGF